MYFRADAIDVQTPWECRWTRLDQTTRSCARQDETIAWICTRAGHRRHVNDARCEACEYWQPPHAEEIVDDVA